MIPSRAAGMEKAHSAQDRRLSVPQCWSQHNDKENSGLCLTLNLCKPVHSPSQLPDKTILAPDIYPSY